MLKQQSAIALATTTVILGLSACTSSVEESDMRVSSDIASTPQIRVQPLSKGRVINEPATIAMAETESSADLGASIDSRRRDPSNLQPIFPLPKEQHVAIPEQNTENYDEIISNPVVLVDNQPTSTFSIDVDSGAYANTRRFINSGALPPADAVRVEELINYFSYNYDRPENTDTPFSINTEIAQTPWNEKTHLLHVGLKVFLIDVSGSMSSANKLGLLKPAMGMLVNQLNENDTVSIAVYAGSSGTVLEPTPGNQTEKIMRAINSLMPGGSTNGRAGIELAYDLAAANFKEGAVNRVILATDGDFNVGTSNVDELKTLIEKKRKSGIALTTLGFGSGNYNDHLMEQLANVGNGAYAYIDTLNEARKVLSEEVSSTLLTIAKDVKIQIEFNPAVVSEYRLIGYENRVLANEDFANDKIDAGEIGAGHTVTALYEIALVGSGGARNSALRYGKTEAVDPNISEIAELRLRYKAPDGDTSRLISQQLMVADINDDLNSTTDDYRFSAAVAALGQHLRNGKYLEEYEMSAILELAKSARGDDNFGYRQEFLSLVRLAEQLGTSQNAQTWKEGLLPRG